MDEAVVETTSNSGVQGGLEELLSQNEFVVTDMGAPNVPDLLSLISGY